MLVLKMLFAFAVMYARGLRRAYIQSGPEDSSSGTPSIFNIIYPTTTGNCSIPISQVSFGEGHGGNVTCQGGPAARETS